MEKENIYILGIESSCDDTSAAVLCNDRILSNVVADQKIHAEYREHINRTLSQLCIKR